MSLQDKLNNLGTYPFHMPGHKRNGRFGISGAEIDITEIDGFDNLHSPNGVILDIEKKLEKIYKSKKSFISVNGSSGGILSAIHAVCNAGDTIIIARNCHKSVYNACMLLSLKVVYIEPSFDMTNGYYTRLDQETVNTAINRYPIAKAIVITSPTYEGFVSNISSSIPLIIDAAHGAHFGISYFPEYPKGDIVISSLHKTLPALTQTAVVNVYNEKYIDKVKGYMDIFQSTSPSYVLMNSIDICTDYILNNKGAFGDFYHKLCNTRLMETNNLFIQYTDDISKIVLSCANTDITGTKLANILRDKYNIEVEMASNNYVILMTTIGDNLEALDMLENAILDIDQGLMAKYSAPIKKPPVPSGANVISISDSGIPCNLDDSIGRLSNEFVYAYPPDIPIIAPNEEITREAIDYIKNAMEAGINIISDSGELPNKILTKDAL